MVPSSANFSQQKVSISTVNVKEPGYIFTYLSYEDSSANYVYFDDFKVTVTPSKILQANEYYPFGLQTANSWTRDNSSNNFLYDGGNELNATSGFYDLAYRNYDAAVGRFFQVDPFSSRDHNLTPYHYAGNNPIASNDPSGLMRQYVPEKEYREPLHNSIDTNGTWGDDYFNNYGSGGYYSGSGIDGAVSSKVLGDYSTYNNQDLLAAAQSGSEIAKDAYIDRFGQQVFESGHGQSFLGFGPNGMFIANDGSGIARKDRGECEIAGTEFISKRGEFIAFMFNAGESGSEILSKELFTLETGLFTVDAYAQLRLAAKRRPDMLTIFIDIREHLKILILF